MLAQPFSRCIVPEGLTPQKTVGNLFGQGTADSACRRRKTPRCVDVERLVDAAGASREQPTATGKFFTQSDCLERYRTKNPASGTCCTQKTRGPVDTSGMFPVVTTILLLQLPLSVGTAADVDCLFRRGTSVRTEGDVVIGAFFTLFTFFYLTGVFDIEPSEDFSLPQLMPHNYQHVLALVFAIEEINRNPQLLPNVTLGYEFHNVMHGQDDIPNYTCRRESVSVAVLMGTSWENVAQFGTLLERYRFPQLAFGSFNPRLSDKGRFPSLYQLAPKDTALALGMVSLMLHFNWTWVGLVVTEGQKGVQFLSDMRTEMERNGVCIAFVKTFSSSIVSYISVTRGHDFLTKETPPVNVVVIYYDTGSLNDVNHHVGQQLVTWRVWVTNSQWHADMAGRNLILDSFHGTLMFSYHQEEISNYKTFIQTVNPSRYPEDNFLALYWFKNFDCSLSDSDCALKDCALNASLTWLPVNRFDPAISDGSYSIYNAVYAVAHALQEMLCQQVQMQPGAEGEAVLPSPWQLHPFLKNAQFYNPIGDEVNLNDSRKLDAEYDIVNFWNFPEGLRIKMTRPRSVCSESCGPGFRKTLREGKAPCCFDCTRCPENEVADGTDTEQCVRCPDHQYANTQRSRCFDKSVTFLAYEDPLGKALAATALSLTVLTAGVLGLFVKHRDTPIVKANNRGLSYTLLVSLAFCFLCSLLFIGRPNTATCVLQQTTFGVVFTVAVSTVLAKTVTVVLAFKVTVPGRKVRQLLVSGAPNSIIPICSLIQLTLCGIWMGTNPPFIDIDAHSEHGHIIIVCNKGSLTAFYCVLGYLGSLALGSFTVAFLARNLPDTFNEAKFLTFSMLVFCSVWVTFLPVYHSTRGKAMVAMEVFSILASGAGLLGCIFVPKCCIILLCPERNSLYKLVEPLPAVTKFQKQNLESGA
ncbi:vomeronasal type-2 receptor 116-like [Ctenodactylus gundi]